MFVSDCEKTLNIFLSCIGNKGEGVKVQKEVNVIIYIFEFFFGRIVSHVPYPTLLVAPGILWEDIMLKISVSFCDNIRDNIVFPY